MKKKHIVLIVNNIDGGVGTFLTQLKNLSEDSSTIEISLLSLKNPTNASLPAFHTSKFFPYVQNRSTFSLGLSEVIQIFQEIFWLKKEISSQSPHMMVTVDTHVSMLVCVLKIIYFKKTALLISNRNNVRKVVSEKTSFFLQKIIPYAGAILFKQANMITCVSYGLAKDFQVFFKLPNTPFAIPDGINAKRAKMLANIPLPQDDKKLFSSTKNTIISIGRLEKQKDFETLLLAMKLVKKKINNAQLLIIGDGSERKKITALIKKQHLENTVHLLGWRKNVYAYLKHADLFVLSSLYEGFGYVIIEAMSQNIPVVSTDCPYGPSEIVENGKFGVLCRVGDSKKMSEEIIQILTSKKLMAYYRTQSKKRSLFFSEKNMIKQYAHLLSKSYD